MSIDNKNFFAYKGLYDWVRPQKMNVVKIKNKKNAQ